ncbi:TPA: Ail/Lom family outer membrane beta-barrel protein [Salmonella enterica]|nr:Ail/Lom family outer membrane beta-barrel protein [Salmonella enterica]
MKKETLALILSAGIFAINTAQADTHSFTVGYAQSKIHGDGNIRGVNAKYHYQGESPVGIITSLSYMYGNSKASGFDEDMGSDYHVKSNVKYGSLMAGPTYQVTDAFSVYGLVGVGMLKARVKENGTWVGGPYSDTSLATDKGLAWGAGVQMNPVKDVAVNVGYEGNRGILTQMNGFNIGVGYCF